MKFDDDPVVSAYLDGELSPAGRTAFESSMAADPSLAETLEGLRRVRSMVGSLGRPAMPSVDLASAVVTEFEKARRRQVWSPLRVSLMASGLAAAAALWLAFANPLNVRPQMPKGRAVDPRQGQAIVKTTPEIPLLVPPAHSQTGPIQVNLPVVAETRVAADLDRETDRLQIRNWLDGQDVRQLVVKSDPGTRSAELIEAILRSTARKDPLFARLGAIQMDGPVADADSFAVVLRPCELDNLQRLVREAFPGDKVGEVESVEGGPALYPLGENEGLQLIAGTPINPVQHTTDADRKILASQNKGANLDDLESQNQPRPNVVTPVVSRPVIRPQPMTLLLRVRNR